MDSSGGIPAPYGRACTNCSRAKCKCIYRADGDSCERCFRLKRDCHVGVSARKRATPARRSTASRTAALEEKLNDLVSILRMQAPTTVIPDLASADGSPSTQANASPLGSDALQPTRRGHSTYIPPETIPMEPPILTPASSCHSTEFRLPKSVDLTPLEAETAMTNFRTNQIRFFPFVHIPPDISSQQLRQDRPFLWKCIMAASSQSSHVQRTLGLHIRQELAERALVQLEKEFDMLLGVLVVIAWGHLQRKDRPFLSVLTQLAVSLIFDLGLNKPPCEPINMFHFKCPTMPKPPAIKPRTMDERRAVLGCYFVSAVFSDVLKRIDPLRWTPHMEESLQVLSDQNELPTDGLLVAQVRIQRLVDEAGRITVDQGEVSPDTEHLRPPPSFYIKALHAKLADIRASLSPALMNDAIICASLSSAELTINELAYLRQHTTSGSASVPVPVPIPRSGVPDLEQLEYMHACVLSIKTWFDLFFSIPIPTCSASSFPFYSQLAHCLMSLHRLTNVESPAWDKAAVRKTVDLFDVAEKLIDVFNKIREHCGPEWLAGCALQNAQQQQQPPQYQYSWQIDSDADIFLRSATLIRILKTRWEEELEEIAKSRPPEEMVSPESLIEQQQPPLQMPDETFFDDRWLTDFFATWD